LIVIWKGRGLLIAVVTFGCLLALDAATRLAFAEEHYYEHHGWPKLVGFWLAAGIVFWARGILRVPPLLSRDEYIDPREELPGIERSPHESELFFLRARYWPPLLLLLGVVFFFVRDY
jgi:hypothetical protein